ncbi:MAG: ATP-binding protein, partial [Ilumatobacteraceae bacterium]
QEQRNYLEIALHHSERLAKLIAELFELAKLDAQSTPLALEPIAMGELVQDVVQELQLAAQQKGVVLNMELQDDLPFVNIDIGLMERVLENLIDNALRYTPSGGTVTVSLVRQDETIRVQISDTGCGIAPDDLPYIFDRFYRVEKTRHQQIGGSGLGLAITKRIMELHGTSIQASSIVNRGTIFSFNLNIYESTQASYSTSRNFSHKVFDEVLQAHVKNGVVDYSAIASDARFSAYLEQLNQIDPHALPTRSKRLAFWINAYNACAIKGILDGYSPENLVGRYRYFISKQYRIGGKALNLRDLQRKILIPEFQEPRTHFAIVCASASCPKLLDRAYNAEILEALLEQSAIAFINDPARNCFDRKQKRARLSRIFKWFEKDFVASAGSLTEYVRPYIADPDLARTLVEEHYEIEFIDYNWGANGPFHPNPF